MGPMNSFLALFTRKSANKHVLSCPIKIQGCSVDVRWCLIQPSLWIPGKGIIRVYFQSVLLTCAHSWGDVHVWNRTVNGCQRHHIFWISAVLCHLCAATRRGSLLRHPGLCRGEQYIALFFLGRCCRFSKCFGQNPFKTCMVWHAFVSLDVS